MTLGAGRRGTTTRADGFEDATVTSPDVVLTGTGSANVLEVNACRATASGRGGRDAIRARRGTYDTGWSGARTGAGASVSTAGPRTTCWSGRRARTGSSADPDATGPTARRVATPA